MTTAIEVTGKIRLCLFMGMLTLLVCPCPAIARVADTSADRPRVAVVLSGGGAKGVAHISALKVIEEEGIPIDYIAGTSMGAIIGGLYALGYSPSQLDTLVRNMDWEWLLSDRPKRVYRTLMERENEKRYILSVPMTRRITLQKPESIGKGQNISDMFAALTVDYHDSIDFRRLPIPFACVATNLTDGSEVILERGVLAEAMRASMAIPGVFSPVRKDSLVLIDGGMVNNFPVDVARRMGADIVIGVDVQQGLHEADKLNSLSGILSQIVDIACQNKYKDNRQQTDVYIKVNVQGYSAASFTRQAIDTLIRRGWQAADSRRNELRKVAARIGQKEIPQIADTPHSLLQEDIFIKKIRFEGACTKDDDQVIRRCRLHENNWTSYARIEEALAVLRGELNYSEVSYRLFKEEDGYQLVFYMADKNATAFNIGARFDTEEIASLLLNSSFYFSTRMPSSLSITGRLGKQYMADVKYSFQPSLMRNVNLCYTYFYHDIDFYRRGNKTCNATYNHHAFEASYSSVWLRNFSYRFGLAYECYHHADLLYREDAIPSFTSHITDNTVRYFVRLDYNSQDNAVFPTRGLCFSTSGSVYTDNLVGYYGHSPFYSLSGSIDWACSFNDRLTLLPAANVRILEGDDIPLCYTNVLGGEMPSRYLTQQIPFVGAGHAELSGNALLAASIKLRYRLTGKHYLSCMGNIASDSEKFSRINRGSVLYGIGMNYALGTVFGPVGLTVGYSNLAEKFYCFANIGYCF